jgi:hypothetical protein
VSAYTEFLRAKAATARPAGRAVNLDGVTGLHPWQSEIVTWACQQGRAAIFSDTGTGKTRMQLVWAERMRGDGSALVVAPLAVTAQTMREARVLGLTVTYARRTSDVTGPGLWITNYERVADFDPGMFAAVVLDESSILKQSDGKTRTRLIETFAGVPYRLACSATPAPNDPEELTNQAEFLGVATRVNMLSAYFVHDNDGWRLKGHAKSPMFRWMASWAVAIRRPSDMGYSDDGYILPGLDIVAHEVSVPIEQDGQLFATDLGGVGGRAAVRRSTLIARCAEAAALVAAEPDEPWLLWCGLNDEADRLAAMIPGAVNVAGNWTPEDKADALLAFADGGIRYLVTKPSIAAQGMNWQHCARMVFVGLSDSYEAYYQAIRRCYRYGQTRPVQVHLVLSELEGQIAANVRRKESEAAMLAEQMVAAMRKGKRAA